MCTYRAGESLEDFCQVCAGPIACTRSSQPTMRCDYRRRRWITANPLRFPQGRVRVLQGAQVVQMPALLVIGLWIVLPLFSGIFRSGLLNHSLMCRSSHRATVVATTAPRSRRYLMPPSDGDRLGPYEIVGLIGPAACGALIPRRAAHRLRA